MHCVFFLFFFIDDFIFVFIALFDVDVDSMTFQINAELSRACAKVWSLILLIQEFDFVDSGGNVMLTQDSMTLKVLDFGMARKLRQDFDFNHDALKNDILNTIRLFCGLYIGQDFENNFVLEKEIKHDTLRQVCTSAFSYVGNLVHNVFFMF